ncbi:cation acetate symporter [Caldimonas thermodepolymerans]|uniref:Cation acetate symporter n=1 Tax=Caldimonas thermodepolymerans TaxID=215580 RepID=A0A2S5T212_9BURK|nr:sodium:solute symporter family protein [Caldimonas thermodepolymerans]PPE68928.1 cation acetate symporter [Caldimonas thermodepolymerans]QPC30098.1 cation acetate symporter [Caldimonas thermodepolymerans]RDI00473.1 cation/acetate symporter [Caldimonas thermodepolymerans]TCP07248.1 cation/acetate symporter [Caldimonas thermodepolymerans]UZG46516.1 cation acetate symporter [Caldimonas thermodepolymerans]
MAGLTPTAGGSGSSAAANAAFRKQLNKVYGWYTGGFIIFVLVLAVLEQMGLPRNWIGFIFLLATVLLYAGIGIMSRTSDAAEYYVAGRRVPAIYNGMATGADWMSAASFIGMAGTLYLTGYSGLAFIMGWTGGYCLVALFLAPYLRKFGQFTIPDFLGARYGGNLARLIGIAAAILCSFTYVVAQIYGVGIITARLSGLAFEIGIFVGLGGILVCSFLGGMRAVTWTQVAQYIILIIAYMIPVVWLSVKQTNIPLPQLVYGYQLQKVTEAEARLRNDPKELEVIEIFKQQAAAAEAKLKDVPAAMAADKAAAEQRLADLKAQNAPLAEIQAAEKALAALPQTEAEARQAYTAAKTAAEARAKPLGGMPPHAQVFAGDPNGSEAEQATFVKSRRNFLALVFCLMVGTAALPHILMRYYTTPSVKEARESVAWSLFFIFLLYFTAPALAVLVKYEVFTLLVGTPFDQLPDWIAAWSRVDPSLLSVTDVNKDGIFQLGEMKIGGDIIVLATPAIGGLPYVVSGMVAAGGLAAALSTADGLLLTIANALSHDLYYKMIDPNAPTSRRVMISKMLLLVVALCAAYVAAQKPADILFLVSAAFSFAAAAFFPALVLGIFWKRATSAGAVCGMVAGLGLTFYYMATTQPWLRRVFGVTDPIELWWGIEPISAGLFGVPVGFAVIIIVSLITPAPKKEIQELVEHVRYPNLKSA